MPTPARWLLPESDGRAADLASDLGIQPPAARILWNRGFRDPDAARRFLRPSIEDMHDPFLLAGMESAVERLRHAIAAREKILLYGDYDVDGTTSVVILKTAVERAGGIAGFHVPHRLNDGYGMRPEIIEQAAATGVSLVISVDTGIRAAEVVRHASALGIDCIITDHHLPESELPPALAVLNPNRPDCTYPEKNLCGAGVTFKLIQALFRSLDWPADRAARLCDSLMKLVAIATVADVVPLLGENRVIVKHGLAGLRSMRNPGLRALFAVSGFKDGQIPSAGQIAFRIGPRLNAAGRMADAGDAIELLLTADEQRARYLAEQLHARNAERRDEQDRMVEAILRQCESEPAGNQAALVFFGAEWHRGVVGIVASRLVEHFHRPVFVLGEKDGKAQGSGRTIEGFHLLAALESMPDLFERFGGHRQAAGVTLDRDRVGEFRARLAAYAAQRLGPEDFRPRIAVDAEVDFSELNNDAVAEILALAPFGCANPTPRLLVRRAEIDGEPAIWKEKHLRLLLRQNGRSIPVKGWGMADRAGELWERPRIDAILSLEQDSYSRDGWSAVLHDLRAAAASVAV
ncbi:MAG: single-stranded-DNA-specific exonuclease RecJ [Bryobacteraceae bacterium]